MYLTLFFIRTRAKYTVDICIYIYIYICISCAVCRYLVCISIPFPINSAFFGDLIIFALSFRSKSASSLSR